MINPEQRQLLHKYLLIELAVKSLQIDYQKVEQLKMNKIFLPLIDLLLKELRQEYLSSKGN